MYKQDRKAADDAGLNKNAPLPVPNWLWRERALYTLAPPDDESNWDPTPEQLQSPAVCDDLHVPTSLTEVLITGYRGSQAVGKREFVRSR